MWCRNTFTGVKCALEMTIVFPLRIEMSSVKHIVAAAQSWNGKRGRQQRVKLQSVKALTMTDDQGLLQFLFYPFSVHESETGVSINFKTLVFYKG